MEPKGEINGKMWYRLISRRGTNGYKGRRNQDSAYKRPKGII